MFVLCHIGLDVILSPWEVPSRKLSEPGRDNWGSTECVCTTQQGWLACGPGLRYSPAERAPVLGGSVLFPEQVPYRNWAVAGGILAGYSGESRACIGT